jgi:ubiquinone/menaquinone biosynthesis C-methylase UbiE
LRLFLEERLGSLRSNPRAWLVSLGVAKGATVVDLGAGRGLYTLLAAEINGGDALVYAVEPDLERAATIKRRARESALPNVKVIQTTAESLDEIPGSSVDLAFSRNTLHHFSDTGEALIQVRRVLRPGGAFHVRDILRTWPLNHGTRREDLPALRASGFASVELKASWWTLTVKMTK